MLKLRGLCGQSIESQVQAHLFLKALLETLAWFLCASFFSEILVVQRLWDHPL